MENKIVYEFISSFFAVFKAHINYYKISDANVFGSVVWEDENELQIFSWHIEFEDYILVKMKLLCEYLIKNNLVCIDKVKITKKELIIRLSYQGWNFIEAQKNIDYLCSVKIKMIDDGEETDSFFIHF
jgi:hypothetical protein